MTDVLINGLKEIGFEPSPPLLKAFELYAVRLEEENRSINLTAVSGETETARLHFLDSLALLRLYPIAGERIIDIGSGAGFPGLPLRLAEQTVRLTLLDSLAKRVDFLQKLCSELKADDVECLHARAEERSRLAGYRDSYDIAVSRGVARLNLLCELCLPFVRPGGVFLAMKAADSEEELLQSQNAIERLGAETEEVIDYKLPGTDIPRRLIVIKKINSTPEAYPRRFARMQRAPL